MKLLTLCSGIGAPEIAAGWLGWDRALTCEIDPFCRCVLQYFYPSAYHHGDIKTLTGKIVDYELTKRFGTDWRDGGTVLVAGFPCQPFSVAGKRLGASDDRHLWPEVLRLVGEIRPRWFIGENVAGILSMVLPGSEVKVGSYQDVAGESYEEIEVREQFVVERVCSDLESIGYSVIPVVIPACAVGAPHRRDRVWFLSSDSNPNGTGLQAPRPEQPAAGTAGICQERAVAHADGDRRRQRENQQIPISERQGTPHDCLDGEIRSFAHSQRRGRNEMDDKTKPGQPDGTRLDGNGGERTFTNPDGQRRAKLDASPVTSQTGHRPSINDTEIPNWEHFPTTQPAIRQRDDGNTPRLSGITFPKWRSESIRALGNSMVPPLLYEFFKTIQEIENQL